MGGWSFSFEAYFINAYYISDLNTTHVEQPKPHIIDNCGPSNLISSGFALWLVLVPAVACVVQLPGSVFLYRRSNFYRFAPEIGLADCLATILLLARALLRGYGWKESVAAIFLIREGIGRGDLWWRDEVATTEGSQRTGLMDNAAGDIEASAVVDASEGSTLEENYSTKRIKSRLLPYAEPVSLERMIGTALFVVALIRVITVLASGSGNAAVRMTCIIALAYASSFVVFEILVWSLALISPTYSLEDIPINNLLDLLRFVDPGDNPFTFPQSQASTDAVVINPTIELSSVSVHTQTGTGSSQSRDASTVRTSSTGLPWNKAVAFSAVLLGILGPLIWYSNKMSSNPVNFVNQAYLPLNAEARELKSYFAQDEQWVFNRRLFYKHHPTLSQLRDTSNEGCHCCFLIWNHVFARHELSDEELSTLGPIILHQSLAMNETKWNANWYPNPGGYLDIKVGSWTQQWGFGVLRFVQTTSRFSLSSFLVNDLTTIALQMNGLIPSPLGNVRLAKLWLASCWINHPQCFQATIPPMPTRLVDVGPSDGSRQPRLCVPTVRARYLTLSHCWGGIEIAKTTTSNFKNHCREIPMSNLSKTFQQAIQVTRLFGMRVVLTDSALLEALNMCSVYQNGLFNIAASRARNGNEGLFEPTDPLFHTPCIIPQYRIQRRTGQELCTFLTPDRSSQALLELEKQELEGPLFERAWVLQEELLAHATLAFTNKGMVWKCFRSTCSSQDPEQVRSAEIFDYLVRPFKLGLKFSRDPKVLEKEIADHQKYHAEYTFQPQREQVYLAWVQHIELYLLRKITYPSDRLPALHGLASAMKQVLSDSCSGARRCGIFIVRSILHNSGKYEPEKRPKRRVRPPQLYIAPSWSWASMNETPVSWGNYSQLSSYSEGWIKVLKTDSNLNRLDSSDDPTDVCLRVEGMLLPALAREGELYGVHENADKSISLGEIILDDDTDIQDKMNGELVTLLPVISQSEKPVYNKSSTIVCLALKKVEFAPTQYRRIGIGLVTQMEAFKGCSKELLVLI
ncbi:hypothetical protein B7463_g11096, partial [Scytalidium lignicola]